MPDHPDDEEEENKLAQVVKHLQIFACTNTNRG
jgi:hypothetical protein